jgi:hypothetical protein
VKLAYLPEVAALISAHSYLVLDHPDPLGNAVLGDFYIHSRNRFNRWFRNLKDVESGVTIRTPRHLIGLSPVRPPIQSITEQIVISDLLNRVWSVAVIANDRKRQEDRAESLAKNVLKGHSVVRQKALRLCVEEKSLTARQMTHIQQLQVSAERWSDLLCCTLMGQFEIWEYAYDLNRAKEFYEERFGRGELQARSPVWNLILAGLRHSFKDAEGLSAPLHDDDRLVTRAILDAFPVGDSNMAIWSGQTMASLPH